MIKVYYLLSEKGRKDSLLKGGDGKRIQILETEILKHVLDLESSVVDNEGNASLLVGFNLNPEISGVAVDCKFKTTPEGEGSIYIENQIKEFDKIQTLDKLIEFERNRIISYKKSYKIAEEKLVSYQKYYKQLEEIHYKNNLRDSFKQIQEEENYKRKKEQWIDSYGSKYLKGLRSGNYDYHNQYVKELKNSINSLAKFKLDFNNKIYSRRNITPSPKAIEMEMALREQGFNPEVVLIEIKHLEEEAISILFEGVNMYLLVH